MTDTALHRLAVRVNTRTTFDGRGLCAFLGSFGVEPVLRYCHG